MGTSTRVGKYMKTPNTTPARLPNSVFSPARASIHSGLDDHAHHANGENAHDQQGEDLLDKMPRFPQEIALLIFRQAFAQHPSQNGQQSAAQQ